FFPGGAGLSEVIPGQPLPQFPTGGVMILGHNYYSVEGFREQLELGKADDQYPTARNLFRILADAGIPKPDCFFTNFFMGLTTGPNTGTFPGARDPGFVESCRQFLRFQLQVQRPRLVLVLGPQVPRFLAPLSPVLKSWQRYRSFRELDENGLSLITDIQVSGVDSTFTVAILTHPSLRGPNVRHRRF